MQRVAGRAAFQLSMTTTSYSQTALALASGRSSCVSLGLMNAGAQKKSSPRLTGIVVRSSHCLVYARLSPPDSTLHIIFVDHGGYKTEHAPIEPGQMFPNGFLMLFLGLLGSAVQRLSRPDKHAQGKGCE